jgi:protein-S-isoprenylcysteine O-methyltransferase Ste14
MAIELTKLNQVVAFGAAVVYWAGVWVQTRRVRRRIGRSPGVRPKGVKERMLWAGWSLVVVSWLALPFLSGSWSPWPWLAVVPSLVHPLVSTLGILMMAAGYAGTLWCYVAMGNAWRMGIDRKEPPRLVTSGPYGLVRHPIYLFQLMMVAAMTILLPSAFSLFILGIHLVCVLTKAADEEAYLRPLLGQTYEAYCARAGGWFPRLPGKK